MLLTVGWGIEIRGSGAVKKQIVFFILNEISPVYGTVASKQKKEKYFRGPW